MKYIEIYDHMDRIKITDDTTFQDVTVYIPRDIDINDLVVKLTIELLKGGE